MVEDQLLVRSGHATPKDTMDPSHRLPLLPRHRLIAAFSGLPLAGLFGAFSASSQGTLRKTLVAYFSRAGNTPVPFGQIRRAR
jgi:hypothetical protein